MRVGAYLLVVNHLIFLMQLNQKNESDTYAQRDQKQEFISGVDLRTVM